MAKFECENESGGLVDRIGKSRQNGHVSHFLKSFLNMNNNVKCRHCYITKQQSRGVHVLHNRDEGQNESLENIQEVIDDSD